jgi:1,4-alpha-glucan branching enzyme
MFDTNAHEKNAYYWYEGNPADYPDFNRSVAPARWGAGGYVDNVSTAWAPRYWDEAVREMFISSAIALALEFEVDGFRVDQTTSIHSYNALHADGRRLPHVNAFGAKFLRELTRSLKLVKPGVVLIAEDHSNWDGVTLPPDWGGLGFDAVWYADFYHHLIGDTDKGSDYAKLIKTAGLGDDRALAMDFFAGALQATQGGKKVVYHESHDEAGNGQFTHRTIHTAVNGAPLVGATRTVAEARCRFAAGMAMLSAGIPMFLFGEEVGAEKDFLYGKVLENREDLRGLKAGSGSHLFKFYADLIRLRRDTPAINYENIDVVFTHNEHRLIAFRRWIGPYAEVLVVGSLNNQAFNSPSYVMRADRLFGGRWREIFNSDAEIYGGDNIGNAGGIIENDNGSFGCVIPARGFVVFQKLVGRFGHVPT